MMAMTQAANLVERIIGHGDNATVTTDVSNYNNEHGMETGEMIQATTWQGKNHVKVGKMVRLSLVALGAETVISANAQATGD